MIKLPAVFASGALFQQRSRLGLRGTAALNSPVNAKLTRGGALLGQYETVSGADGAFTLALDIPEASFEPMTLTLTDNDHDGGTLTLDNILSGELWLASGQSNMEMPNVMIRGKDALYAEMADKPLRIYAQSVSGGINFDGKFPVMPQDDLPGEWITPGDTAKLDGVSALATAFILELYEKYGAAHDTPIGFLNVTIGATTIETWLPREAVLDGGAVEKYMSAINQLPTEERFNTYGGNNFTQPCALYNLKVAPLAGVKSRGAVWYQGESNIASRESGAHYLDCLKAYQRYYEAMFRSEGADSYPMISAMLYPWLYSEDECTFGYLNRAFTDAAELYPDKFAAAPIYDLPPIWAFGMANHPIHPSNKFAAGRRMAELAINSCYGGKGLRSAVTYKSVSRRPDCLIVRFNRGRYRLSCSEPVIRGCYIAGKAGLYVEADAELLPDGTLKLSHPYVKEPKQAAYMVSCMEHSGRLYCGGLPVAPFMTERKAAVRIEPKPWLHTENDSVFAVKSVDMSDFRRIDVYSDPTWTAEGGASICRDSVFSVTRGALRIFPAPGTAKAVVYAPAYIANRLDMFNYSGMTFNVICTRDAVIRIGFEYSPSQSESVTRWFDAVPDKNGDPDGDTYHVAFELPRYYCSRVLFEFDLEKCPVRAAELDNITLIPKS